MARIALLSDDLLFGSRVQAELSAAGHSVSISAELQPTADLVILDLTSAAHERLSQLGARPPRCLAFYSHVEVDVREAAQAAGCELVVPRSRMAREGAALVASMLSAT